MATTRQRKGKGGGQQGRVSTVSDAADRSKETVAKSQQDDTLAMKSWVGRLPVWIVLAVASGACAAIVGVFAKLTTTSLTGSLATWLSTMLGLSPDNTTVSLALRGTFFGLNLLFNFAMWTLYTAALTKGNSTTRVSIVNVSANFFVTAMLGWAIFSENLPLGWWLGAGLLAAGNVVIGSSREGEEDVGKGAGTGSSGERGASEEGVGLMDQQPGQADLIDLNDMSSPPTAKKDEDEDDQARLRRAEDADAPI